MDGSAVVSTKASGLWCRRSVIVTACLLAVAGGIGTYLVRRGVVPAEASRAQPPGVPVSVATATRQDVPLALGHGTGSEMRQPLGYAMVGGLALSQGLTLYTTPVVYLYLDRFQQWLNRRPGKHQPDETDLQVAAE
jgi:multidrug efflux pump subunit AcrB